MGYLLRKIRRSRWIKLENTDEEYWSQINPDALGDLSTKDQTLSFWLIDSDKSNLERVISSMAAVNDPQSNFDYALISLQKFEELFLIPQGLNIIRSEGNTYDEYVNKNWHRDLTSLSVMKLCELADLISSESQITRIWPKNVLKLVANGVKSGHINKSKINDKYLTKIKNVIDNSTIN
jgi:hypothetical protein